MNPLELMSSARNGLESDVVQVGGTQITLGSVVTAGVILALGFVLSKLARSAVQRAFALRGLHDAGTTAMVQRITHYVVMSVTVLSALQTVGIDLDALLAAGAVFAVGFGLAMQSIAQNFVSGVILLLERSIRPGDVIGLDGEMVRVEELTIRSTIVRTLDDEHLIVPNSVLAQGTVRNYTKRDAVFRLRVSVGVAYASEVPEVMKVLDGVGRDMDWAIPDRPPVVVFRDFGTSAMQFELSVWTEDPWQALLHRSAMHLAIWERFKDAGITIAYPQIDVHLDAANVSVSPAAKVS